MPSFSTKRERLPCGNRLADEFIPVNGHNIEELARVCLAASLFDETPEGRSIVALARNLGANLPIDGATRRGNPILGSYPHERHRIGTAREYRKGAVEAIKGFVRSRGGSVPDTLDQAQERVSRLGELPWPSVGVTIFYGVIYSKTS
ncbi:MAG UNVERIFIED_CONTAM: hypothetical protein LVR29_14185 [Microcystis novacekii LVE1205-3]|jgi:K+-transporting ATPase ATPase B chain